MVDTAEEQKARLDREIAPLLLREKTLEARVSQSSGEQAEQADIELGNVQDKISSLEQAKIKATGEFTTASLLEFAEARAERRTTTRVLKRQAIERGEFVGTGSIVKKGEKPFQTPQQQAREAERLEAEKAEKARRLEAKAITEEVITDPEKFQVEPTKARAKQRLIREAGEESFAIGEEQRREERLAQEFERDFKEIERGRRLGVFAPITKVPTLISDIKQKIDVADIKVKEAIVDPTAKFLREKTGLGISDVVRTGIEGTPFTKTFDFISPEISKQSESVRVGIVSEVIKDTIDKPVTTAATFGVGTGIGALFKITKQTIRLGKVGKRIAKGTEILVGTGIGGLIIAETIPRVISAPTPETKGEEIGKTIKDVAVFGLGARVGARAVTVDLIRQPLRPTKKPTFVEISRVKDIGGKQVRVADFKITGEVRPPIVIAKSTPIGRFFGIIPKIDKIIPARSFITKTITPAIEGESFLTATRVGRGRVQISEISGSGKIINLETKLPSPKIISILKKTKFKVIRGGDTGDILTLTRSVDKTIPPPSRTIKTIQDTILPVKGGGKGESLVFRTRIDKTIPISPKAENIKEFLLVKLAEDITKGVPVSIARVPKVISKANIISTGKLQNIKILDFKTKGIIEKTKFKVIRGGDKDNILTLKNRADRIDIVTPKLGKTTDKFETISRIKLLKEGERASISESVIVFKDITFPFAKPTGKVLKLKGIIIDIKEPITKGKPDVNFIKTVSGKQTINIQTPVTQLPKTLPKELTKGTIGTTIKSIGGDKVTLAVPSITPTTKDTKQDIKISQVNIQPSKTLTLQKPKVTQKIGTSLKLDTIQETSLLQKQIFIQKPLTKIETIQQQKPLQKEKITQQQKLVTKLVTPRITTPPPPAIFRTPPPPPPPRRKIITFPSLRLGTPKSIKTTNGFGVAVRRFGKFKTIAGGLSLPRAIGVGRERVGKTLAATFKIIPTTGSISTAFRVPKGFRRGKGLTFIERRGLRLSTIGETREITTAKRRKRRASLNKITIGGKI